MNKKWIASGLLTATLSLTEASKLCTTLVQNDYPTFQSLVFKNEVTVAGTKEAQEAFDTCLGKFGWTPKEGK